MDWVVESPIALALCFPDETSGDAESFLDKARSAILRVPSLWWYEISNAIAVARRRERLNEAEVVATLEQLAFLPFRTDTGMGWDTVRHLCALSRDFGLSSYDAAYLELAQRKSVGLATLDLRLNAAARDAGLKTITL